RPYAPWSRHAVPASFGDGFVPPRELRSSATLLRFTDRLIATAASYHVAASTLSWPCERRAARAGAGNCGPPSPQRAGPRRGLGRDRRRSARDHPLARAPDQERAARRDGGARLRALPPG